MKKIFILLAFSLAAFYKAYNQSSIESVIAEIIKNNTTLAALRKDTDAELISNKTGIFISNPEFGINYFKGRPAEIGNRTDYSFIQSFDFPSAYIYRKQISDYRNIQAELDFKEHSLSIITRVKNICNDLIYYNAMKAELLKRLDNSGKIAEAYKKMYAAGEINLLDNNKAQLNLLNLKKEAEAIDIERNVLLSELQTLNGGKALNFTDSVFQAVNLENNFEEWFKKVENNNPYLQWMEQEIIISQKNTKLNSALSLPKFEAGYMSENVVGEQYQGLTLGLSIPLFENKNTVKYARAKASAVEELNYDYRVQYYNELKTLHSKAVSLQNSLDELRSGINAYNNSQMLLIALEKGEISLTEYLFELTMYYESYNKLMVMERDLHKTVTELNRYQ